MRQNTKKFKPNPSKTSRHSIRGYSIRDIIGDRRFNHQISHANPHGIEGIKKVKRMKVDDTEADDLPNIGRNSSSNQFEVAEDPRRCCGDFAAKTSEYAFFKKIKQTTSSNIHVHLKSHDNQVNNVQQSDHSTREEIPNVQKESVKYARSSLPVEKERDDAYYSFLSPPFCGSKNLDVNNALEADGTNVVKVTPREYNRLSPPVKTFGNKGVFSVKREKLRCRVADISLNEYDVNELSSKGIDLVSALISRILPEDHEKNCQDETNSKYKLPSSSESLIKGHEANKRKSIKSLSHHISYLDDDFRRSSSERRHLEWNHDNGLESFFPPKSDHYHSDAYKRKCGHISSYLDDDLDLPRSSERLTVIDMDMDMDVLEWNPNHSDSSKSSIQYDGCYSEAYKKKWIKSGHIPYLDGIPISLEWNPTGSTWYNQSFRIPNLGKDLEAFYFDNDPTLLEKPVPLLLGWEEKSEKDEFQREMNTFSSSQDDDENQLYMMPVERHLKEDHFVSSSIIQLPYTPKHVMSAVEDFSMKNHTWCLNEKQEPESPSPAKKDLISFIHSGDEKENNFMSYSYPEGFDDILLLLGGDS